MGTNLRFWWWAARVALFVAPLVLGFDALAQDPPVPTEPGAADPAADPVADALAEAAVEEGGGVFKWVVLVGAVAVLGALSLVGRRFANAITLVGGFGFIFVGERLFGDGAMHWPLTALGLVGVGLSLALRVRAWTSEPAGARQDAQRVALIAAAVSAASLGLYAWSTDAGVAMLGLDEAAGARVSGVLGALFPIVLFGGLLPTLFVDRALADHPVLLPAAAPSRAAQSGLATALALSLLFPLNYVAHDADWQWELDMSYFRVTDLGTATRGVARSLPEPVVAYLYFDAGSDVGEKVEPYFRKLADASEGLVTVERVDQALRPDLAEAHNIRENGYVVLARGDDFQKFKIGTELDRARRELKKLDGTVQKHLLKLASDQRNVYFLTGHGEAGWRERENPGRKLAEFKRTLEDLNFKVDVLGVTEGSAVAIPEDAALLVVAAPELEILPEEEAAILAYLDRGGALLLMLDPGAARVPGLLSRLGVQAGSEPIAHETAHAVLSRGIADRVLLATNRFGTHESVTTVSRNSTVAYLLMPTVVSVEATPDASGVEVTTLVRSPPDSWEEVDRDFAKSATETSKVFDLAVAVEPSAGDGFRALVIGDVSVFSDVAFASSRGNAAFADDAAKWLVGDEEIVGETQSEEDVEIRHTREGDVAFFWGTILGVPMLVLAMGAMFVNLRRRAS
jgi:hypothetical protein